MTGIEDNEKDGGCKGDKHDNIWIGRKKLRYMEKKVIQGYNEKNEIE